MEASCCDGLLGGCGGTAIDQPCGPGLLRIGPDPGGYSPRLALTRARAVVDWGRADWGRRELEQVWNGVAVDPRSRWMRATVDWISRGRSCSGVDSSGLAPGWPGRVG